MSTVLLCPTCAYEGKDLVTATDGWCTCPQCQCRWNEEIRTDEIPWRCFHCGEICKTDEEAFEHFGATQFAKPACQLAPDLVGLVAIIREQEVALNRLRAEDTPAHREWYALGAKHSAELREQEEKGYARGLADGQKMLNQ